MNSPSAPSSITYLVIFFFLLWNFSLHAQADTDQNGVRSTVINRISAQTQVERFKIAEISFNSIHYQNSSIVTIELFNVRNQSGYDKYDLELGHQQGTSTTSPKLTHSESKGISKNAMVVLGTPEVLVLPDGSISTRGGHNNMVISVYVDVKPRSQYIVKITHLKNLVESLSAENEIIIYDTPGSENTATFNRPTFSDPNNHWTKTGDDLYYNEGAVGIGTDDPDDGYSLHVNGRRTKIGGDVYQSLLRIEADNTSGSPAMTAALQLHGHGGRGKGIYITDKNSSDAWFIGEGYDYRGLGIGYSSSNQTEYGDNAKLFISISGSIGIGTTTPRALLHVKNGNNTYGAILANANEHNFQLYTKTLTTVSNQETFRLGMKYGGNENNGFISFYRGGSGVGGSLGFATNGIERIRVVKNGNVGIGVSDPQARLVVDGNVQAEEIKVQIIDGPDYVFEADYALRTLADVRAYIDQYGHLPEVPSAVEMESEGINVGEMNMLLLLKVEELTLYTLQQEEKIRAQQAEIDRIAKDNKQAGELLKAIEKRLSAMEEK